MKTRQELKVFIGCPSDCEEERDAMLNVIDQINGDFTKHGVRIDVVNWLTHSTPDVGSDPQAVVCEEVGAV